MSVRPVIALAALFAILGQPAAAQEAPPQGTSQPAAAGSPPDASRDAGTTVDETNAAIEDAKKAAIEAIEKAREAFKKAISAAKQNAGPAIDKAKEATLEALDKAKQATSDVLDKAKQATEEVLESAEGENKGAGSETAPADPGGKPPLSDAPADANPPRAL